jgi:hypothetical protein
MPEDADNTSRHRQLRPEDFASSARSGPGDDDDARDDDREEPDHA